MTPVRTSASRSGSMAKRPVKPRTSPRRLADVLLDLQRAVGNAAVVARLLDARATNPVAPPLPQIQRCGPTACDCPDQERTDYAVTHGDESVVQRDVTDDLAALIAKDLAEYTAQNRNPFPHIREVFHGLDSDIEDNVAAAFVERLGPQDLEAFAMTEQGRSVMDLLTEAMLTGHVTSFEALQADRILAAQSRWMSADEHEKAVRRIAALRYHAEDTAGQLVANELALKVASSLATFAAGRRYDEVTAVLHDTDSNVEDNVASHLIELLTTPQLEEAAKDPAGVTMLDVCYDALITGSVTSFENLQGDRILAARVKGRNIGAGEVEKVLQNPTIFPLETSWDSSATIVASLETDGSVKVYYDTWTGASREKYAKEMATLTTRFGEGAVLSGMSLKPDEIVLAKLYDQDGEPQVPIPAIKLIDLANRQLQDFEGKFEKVTILGATVGLGAVGGAGVLGALDTAAFTISAASVFVDAYRSDIAKTAGGRAFLEVWDVVQGVADLYGWGRLGVDGLHVLRAKLAPALRDWRAESLAGLSDAERATIGQAQREADKWVGGVEQAEAAEAKRLNNAEHPPADEIGSVHASDAHEPAEPHGAGTGPVATHDASGAVGEAGSEIHVHDDRIVVCQLCEDLPKAVGEAIHDETVGPEVADAQNTAAHGEATDALAKTQTAVLDAEKANNKILSAQKKRFKREFKSDTGLVEQWDRAKAMKPGPNRAAAIADVEARANQVKAANDQYMQSVKEKVDGLKERIPKERSAANELEAFYQSQFEWVLDDLRKAEDAQLATPWRRRDIPKPKRDPMLDDALTKKRAESAKARVLADEERHVPHEADVLVVRNDGEIVVPERHFVSGGVTEAERAEHGLNEANTRSHTEAKALREIGVQADQTMYIYGQYDPCQFCRRRMQAAVDASGGKIVYIWQGGIVRFARK